MSTSTITKRFHDRLATACTDMTDAAIHHLCATTGLTWIGPDAPVFILGSIRARGLFRGKDGRHWADAALVAESLIARRNDMTALTRDYWTDAAGHCTDAHDLIVATPERGEWNAVISPLDQIAVQLDLPAPKTAPDGWARSWSDSANLSDWQYLNIGTLLQGRQS